MVRTGNKLGHMLRGIKLLTRYLFTGVTEWLAFTYGVVGMT